MHKAGHYKRRNNINYNNLKILHVEDLYETKKYSNSFEEEQECQNHEINRNDNDWRKSKNRSLRLVASLHTYVICGHYYCAVPDMRGEYERRKINT